MVTEKTSPGASPEGPGNWLKELREKISSLPGRELSEAKEIMRKTMESLVRNSELNLPTELLYSEGRVMDKAAADELDSKVILVPLPNAPLRKISKETEPPVVIKKLRIVIQDQLREILGSSLRADSKEQDGLWSTRYVFNDPADPLRQIEIYVRISKSMDKIIYGIGVAETPDLDRK